MNTTRRIILSFIALAASSVALLAKPIPGPKGGRIVTTEAPHVELFVAADRTVVVSLYDKDLKSVAVAGQAVTATAEAKTGKVKLSFVAKDGVLVSTAALPAGDDYTIVLQVRDTATAKPKNFRVLFHEEICAECKRAEYACTCDDAGGEGGHDH